MNKSGAFAVSVTVLGVLFSAPVGFAETIRCGTVLVREGMAITEIQDKCGPPSTIETKSEPIFERRPDGSTYQIGVEPIEIWRYDFGPRRFPVVVTVKSGVAQRIDRVSRNP